MKPDGSRGYLDAVVKRKNVCPWQEMNRDTSVMNAGRRKNERPYSITECLQI
jgi:ribosome modulation factor